MTRRAIIAQNLNRRFLGHTTRVFFSKVSSDSSFVCTTDHSLTSFIRQERIRVPVRQCFLWETCRIGIRLPGAARLEDHLWIFQAVV